MKCGGPDRCGARDTEDKWKLRGRRDRRSGGMEGWRDGTFRGVFGMQVRVLYLIVGGSRGARIGGGMSAGAGIAMCWGWKEGAGEVLH